MSWLIDALQKAQAWLARNVRTLQDQALISRTRRPAP